MSEYVRYKGKCLNIMLGYWINKQTNKRPADHQDRHRNTRKRLKISISTGLRYSTKQTGAEGSRKIPGYDLLRARCIALA